MESSTGSRTLPNDSSVESDSGLAAVTEPDAGSWRSEGLVPENLVTQSVLGSCPGLGPSLVFDPGPANGYNKVGEREVGADGNEASTTAHKATTMESPVALPLPGAVSDPPLLGQQLESGSFVDVNGIGTGDDIIFPTEGATHHHDRSPLLQSFEAQHENELDPDSEIELEMGDEVDMHMGTPKGMKSGGIVGGKCCCPTSESNIHFPYKDRSSTSHRTHKQPHRVSGLILPIPFAQIDHLASCHGSLRKREARRLPRWIPQGQCAITNPDPERVRLLVRARPRGRSTRLCLRGQLLQGPFVPHRTKHLYRSQDIG